MYDDIIDVETARREHRRFVAVLERFAQVYFVRDLVMEVADHPEVRDLLIRETMDIARSEPLARELIMKSLFMYSPHLTNRGILYDGSVERRLATRWKAATCNRSAPTPS